ncbi:MAG: glycosyltransferase family 2 protein [candidate division Zixibacteria bacterium]|nr:glycosyltransferase family 2 protein [candidate division Zixibacteria bacterium]
MNSLPLTIILPVYNEAETVSEVIQSLLDLPLEMEIIAVDNGSTDKTADQLAKFESQKNFRHIKYDKLQGKGAAIREGLKHARGEFVIIQDGDLEYDPRDIVNLYNLAREKNADAVFGSRIRNPQSGVSYMRYYWGGRFLTWLSNRLYKLELTDQSTCYKLVRRELLEDMNLKCIRFEFCSEVVAKLGKMNKTIHEAPISYNPRSMAEGKKIRWIDGLEGIWTLLKLFIK